MHTERVHNCCLVVWTMVAHIEKDLEKNLEVIGKITSVRCTRDDALRNSLLDEIFAITLIVG